MGVLGVCWEDDVGVVTAEDPAECWIDDEPATKEDEAAGAADGLVPDGGAGPGGNPPACFPTPVKLARETLELSGILLGTLNRVQSWTWSRQVCSCTVMAQPMRTTKQINHPALTRTRGNQCPTLASKSRLVG